MDWLIGSKQSEVKKLIAQLADATRRDRAAQELIRMGGDAVPSLVEALQTKDLNLLPLYQQILARIPSAGPVLIKTLSTAHPILRGRGNLCHQQGPPCCPSVITSHGRGILYGSLARRVGIGKNRRSKSDSSFTSCTKR